jgi:hypothetical protein
MKTILVGVTSSAVALAAASAAAAAAAFVTPAKAAYCGVSEGEPPFQLICWRPRDGLTLSTGRRGKGGEGNRPRESRVSRARTSTSVRAYVENLPLLEMRESA